MNVGAFSMPEAAYFDPTAYGDLTGVNGWVCCEATVVRCFHVEARGTETPARRGRLGRVRLLLRLAGPG